MRKYLASWLLGAFACISVSSAAQADTEFKLMKSPKGIAFWYDARPDLPKNVIIGAWRDGVGLTTPGKEGLSSVAAALISRGAGDHSANDINESLDDAGADASIYNASWSTYAVLTAPSEHFSDAANILRDIFTAPKLEQKELDKIETSYADNLKTMDTRAEVTAIRAAAIYGDADNPENRLSDPSAYQNVTREDVENWRRRVLARDNLLIAAEGPMSADDFGRNLDLMWADLPEKSDVPQRVDPIFHGAPKTIVVESQQPQTVIVQIAQTEIRADKARLKAAVGIDVLGDGFESRIVKAIRQKLGASYGISAQLASRQTHDLMIVAGAVANDKAVDALTALNSEYETWREKGITQQEFDAAISREKSNADNAGQRPGGNALAFISAMQADRPPNDSFDYAERLASYTADQVNAEILKQFPPAPLLTIIVASSAAPFKADCVRKNWRDAVSCKQ